VPSWFTESLLELRDDVRDATALKVSLSVA